MYDVIIVGGGVAGLYAAHRLTRERPGIRLVVLEAAAHAGGRAGTAEFAGVQVATGAGIGRVEKDRLLWGLLRELGVPAGGPPVFPVTHGRGPGVADVDVARAAARMRAAMVGRERRPTFRSLGRKVLGDKAYAAFVTYTGFSDYEAADATDVLDLYGLDDVAGDWRAFGVPWAALVRALCASVGPRRIRLNAAVAAVATGAGMREGATVTLADGSRLRAKAVVLATPIDALCRLFPNHLPFAATHGQPFMRIYAQAAPESRAALGAVLAGGTAVAGPLQMIIPMDAGVYMAAYSDNRWARALERQGLAVDGPQTRERLARLMERALGLRRGAVRLLQTQAHWWPAGTHYNAPLPPAYADRAAYVAAAQRPAPRVWAAGEAVALHQGWVEGAFESVAAVLADAEFRRALA